MIKNKLRLLLNPVMLEDEDKLISVKVINGLRSDLAKATQKVYDEWDQSDEENGDPELGFGGICQDVADKMASVLSQAGIEVSTVSNQSGEQHVYCVVKVEEGVYNVDIPPRVYEIGSGYNWKKRPNVKISPNDINIDMVDDDPTKFEEFLDESIKLSNKNLISESSFESESYKLVLNDLSKHIPKSAFSAMYVHNSRMSSHSNYEVFIPKNRHFPEGFYYHAGQASNSDDAKYKALSNLLRKYEPDETINESMDTKSQGKLEPYFGGGVYRKEEIIDGDKYSVEISPVNGSDENREFAFYKWDEKEKDWVTNLTGKSKNPGKVISIIFNLVFDWIEEHKPKTIYMSADRGEESRIRLYDRLTQKIKKFGYIDYPELSNKLSETDRHSKYYSFKKN